MFFMVKVLNTASFVLSLVNKRNYLLISDHMLIVLQSTEIILKHFVMWAFFSRRPLVLIGDEINNFGAGAI